jgi:hypothetical protein
MVRVVGALEGVLEAMQDSGYVYRHGKIHSARFIMPLEFYAAIEGTCPICRNFIFLFQICLQVPCVLPANIHDAEVVGD